MLSSAGVFRVRFILSLCLIFDFVLVNNSARADELVVDGSGIYFTDSLTNGELVYKDEPKPNQCIKGCCERNFCKYEFDPDLMGNQCGTDPAFPNCDFDAFIKCRDDCDRPIVAHETFTAD